MLTFLFFVVSSATLVVENGTFLPFHLRYDCQTVDSCIAPNVQAPYSRGLFPSKNDTLRQARLALLNQDSMRYQEIMSGAHPLTLQDGLVVYGQIPSDEKLYWAVTPYCFSVCDCVKDDQGSYACLANTSVITWASLTDSFSVARIQPRSTDDHMVLIFSFNPNVVAIIQDAFLLEWQKVHPNLPLQVFPVVLPADLYNPCYTYDIVSRVALYTPRQRIPRYRIRWYTSTDSVAKFGDSKPLLPRSATPSEQGFMSIEEWRKKATQIVLDQGYEILNATIQTSAYLSDVFPGGLDTGAQCISARVNCRNDNRDARYMSSENVEVSGLRGEAILAVALDHSATLGARYSNIGFYNASNEVDYDGSYTGRFNEYPLNPVPPNTFDSAIRLVYSVPPWNVPNVFLVERIYYTKTSGVGPATAAVLPMVVFKVKQNSNKKISS